MIYNGVTLYAIKYYITDTVTHDCWSLLRHCTRLDYSGAVSAQSYQPVCGSSIIGWYQVCLGMLKHRCLNNIQACRPLGVLSGRDEQLFDYGVG